MSRRLRIAAGDLKGRGLTVPPGIRPTSGRVRESLMDIWAPRLPGARVLELFAGSGAVGLESVSRGAASAVLVEGDRRVHAVLERNCTELAPERTRTLCVTLPAGPERWPKRRECSFDLVFADPPYDFEQYAGLLAAIADTIAENGQVAIEHGVKALERVDPAPLELVDRRTYGDTWLSFYSAASATASS